MQFRFSLSETTQINKYNNWYRWTGGRKRKNQIEKENNNKRNNEKERERGWKNVIVIEREK